MLVDILMIILTAISKFMFKVMQWQYSHILKKTMAERGGQHLEDLELRNPEHEDF